MRDAIVRYSLIYMYWDDGQTATPGICFRIIFRSSIIMTIIFIIIAHGLETYENVQRATPACIYIYCVRRRYRGFFLYSYNVRASRENRVIDTKYCHITPCYVSVYTAKKNVRSSKGK